MQPAVKAGAARLRYAPILEARVQISLGVMFLSTPCVRIGHDHGTKWEPRSTHGHIHFLPRIEAAASVRRWGFPDGLPPRSREAIGGWGVCRCSAPLGVRRADHAESNRSRAAHGRERRSIRADAGLLPDAGGLSIDA